MFNDYGQYPHYPNMQMYNPNNMYNPNTPYPYPYYSAPQMYNANFPNHYIKLQDYGPEPFVININEAAKQNNTFRTALWTGEHLQVTLMCIGVGEDIGLEMHPDVDQFIRIEQGQGLVRMGDTRYNFDFEERVYDDFAFVIPAGKWHNLINTGNTPIKLYSIYAPPQHPWGTVHRTKADAEAAEAHHHC